MVKGLQVSAHPAICQPRLQSGLALAHVVIILITAVRLPFGCVRLLRQRQDSLRPPPPRVGGCTFLRPPHRRLGSRQLTKIRREGMGVRVMVAWSWRPRNHPLIRAPAFGASRSPPRATPARLPGQPQGHPPLEPRPGKIKAVGGKGGGVEEGCEGSAPQQSGQERGRPRERT